MHVESTLKIQNSLDSGVNQLLDIILVLRIGPHDKVLIDAIELKIQNEVPLDFVESPKRFEKKERDSLVVRECVAIWFLRIWVNSNIYLFLGFEDRCFGFLVWQLSFEGSIRLHHLDTSNPLLVDGTMHLGFCH